MRSASWTMSLFSWNSFSQPPLTFCSSAIELRVSPLTTLYSPSPFLTFLPVGVVTVLLLRRPGARRSGRRAARRRSVVRPRRLGCSARSRVDGRRCTRRSTGRCRRPARRPCPGRRGPSRRSVDLLGLAGLVGGGGVLRAAVRGPGGGGELQTAVVAVAGVDGPVAAGLALGDGVPLGGGGGGGAARRHQRGGDGARRRHRRAAMARAALDGRRCLPLLENSMDRSPHRRLRGELSGSGRLSCPAAHPDSRCAASPQADSSRASNQPVPALTLGPPLLPTALDATTVPVRPLAGFGVAAAGARWWRAVPTVDTRSAANYKDDQGF